MKNYKKILTIAGSDPSGGAGIQADIKAISACGGYAETVITALTSQNTTGVQGVFCVPTEVVRSQIESVMDDVPCDALKLGMLPTVEIVETVAELIKKYRIEKVVLDPVMISTSGVKLISDEAIEAIMTRLLPLATVITPNVDEASFMSGMAIRSEDDFGAVARKLMAMGAQSVLLKAGHLTGEILTDHLYSINKKCVTFANDRIDTQNTHGTGCTLSSSLATYLAAGYELDSACERAVNYVYAAIKNGAEYGIGHGHGPVHHFHNFWK